MYNRFFYDFIHLFFPATCLACSQKLIHAEKHLCTYCLGTLPETPNHLVNNHQIAQKFYGKVPPIHVVSLYKFTKKSHVQKILHQLKYKNLPAFGKHLGKYYGMLLKKTNYAVGLDAIIPVPLHPIRLQERGYNQSKLIAQGLATALHLPCHDTWLVKKLNTPTQTKKTRQKRWENVQLAFSIPNQTLVKGKQLLLVDDIVTTGSTLTACTQALLESGASTIRIVTLAVAI